IDAQRRAGRPTVFARFDRTQEREVDGLRSGLELEPGVPFLCRVLAQGEACVGQLVLADRHERARERALPIALQTVRVLRLALEVVELLAGRRDRVVARGVHCDRSKSAELPTKAVEHAVVVAERTR